MEKLYQVLKERFTQKVNGLRRSVTPAFPMSMEEAEQVLKIMELNRWIPIEESEPTKEDEYWVMIEGGAVISTYWHPTYGGWQIHKKYITHWRLKPQKYE